MTLAPSPDLWKGRRVSVIGAARSGLAAARLLSGVGAEVFVSDAGSDDGVAARLRCWQHELGGHTDRVWHGRELVVTSPGVPWDAPVLERARAHGVEVIAELELAWRFSSAHVIAITGSNGKSTTTAWLAEVLTRAGFDARVGGNIGVPLSDVGPSAPRDAVLVVEVSSYQLEGIDTFRPRVGMILNITPDHLERHRDLELYGAAKARIFENIGPRDIVVLNHLDPRTRMLGAQVEPDLIRWVGAAPGAWVENGMIWAGRGDAPVALIPVEQLSLSGAHNVENALAVVAGVVSLMEVLGRALPIEAIGEGLRGFSALPHRQETVSIIDDVHYINDSKATNVDSTRLALESYDRGVIWIAGGLDKGSGLEPLVQAARPRVRKALLIGQAAKRFELALSDAVSTECCEDLATAVILAREISQAGDVVLFSPACASFDQYQNFEKRGEAFRRLVTGGSA